MGDMKNLPLSIPLDSKRFLLGFNPSLDYIVPSISKVILELYLGNLRGSEIRQCP